MTTVARSTDDGLRRTRLENGLTVLSEFVPGVRSVALGAWVRAASMHETRERMGLSHLLEHMVFKGTRKFGAREVAASIESLGGSLDAYTARDHTAYQARVLDEHLDEAADVLAELVFRPLLRYEDLKPERKVILEEIAMVDDTPDDLVFELHNEALWGDHPFGYSILGTRETVSRLGVRELRDLHARAYQPHNIVVAAAGNVEHEVLLDALARAGWLDVPPGDAARLPTPPIPTPPPAHRRHVPRDLAQVHMVFGSPSIGYTDPRRFAFAIVSMLLGDGMSSRLFQKVREELGLAYAVHSFTEYFANAGMHGIYVGTAPDTAGQAEAAIRDELARLCAEGLTEAEIAQGKRQLKGQITLSLEGVSSRMYRAAAVELYDQPFRRLDEVLAEVDKVDAATVAGVCRDFFQPDAQTLVRLGPEVRD